MKILKGLLSLLLCLCLITPMGSAIVALNEGGIANMGSQTNSGSPTSAPSVTPAPSDTDTPVEAPDYAALYNDLMAAETFAEAHALLEGLTDEQLDAFIDSLTEEQYAALEEHIDALIAAAEEDGDLEYVYTTVNFTNVAPLLDPVCGSPTRGASVSDDEAGSGNGDSGMEITKNAVANGDGSYTITLEAYATGDKVITEVTEDIPTDIVLVLDQSGSMDFCIVCGNEMDGKNDYHNTYVEATQINTNETYYIKNGSTYSQVDYCDGKHWTYSHEAGWYVSGWSDLIHTSNNRIAPKTEINPDGVQFYLLVEEPCSSRLNALKVAVTAFANAVAEKAKGSDGTLGTEDDVNHRIAVVGFASQSGYGNNTELLSISGTNSGSVGVQYNNITNQNLKDVLQSMDSIAGQNMVKDAIDALAAEGATRVDLGMDMANRILNANPVQAGQERNRVVIVFTDGSPTDSDGFELKVANNAISTSGQIKNAGATVYSVGIFTGANANSAGAKPSGDLGQNNNQMNKACNWFMQNLSSNNGTPKNPSYYLSAGDADALNEIFQQISSNIETGGSSSTLTSDAVVKDIISPQFTLPTGTTVSDITLETYACTGKNGSDYTWRKNADAMGATASISGDQVSVTGFNFSDNYVGTVTENGNTSYRGNKLVIRFTVSPKADFLGGNNVCTNANAGVYENSDAEQPVLTFPKPQVNVPIGEVSVTASDKNVYLLAGLTAAQLADVTVGGVTFDLSANNYGLEDWQTEYVNISVDITDQNGNTITDFTALTADNSYSVSVTVSPKTNGEGASGTRASEKNGTGSGTINVFKPFLTFADSEVWYGGQHSGYLENYKSVVWKHGTDKANTETMGNAPELTLNYATPENAIVEDYIVVPDDIPVNVLVKIGETAIDRHVNFVHADCSHENCGFDAKDCEFILHVNTCSLTVKKAIAEGSRLLDAEQSFIFTVSYPGLTTKEGVTILRSAVYNVVVVGERSRTIVGLPVGDYTVRENTDWSWRYELVEGQNGVSATLPAESPEEAIVTMTNELNNEFWLSDEAVAKNVFNSNSSPENSPMPAIIPGKEDLTDEAD
ncbi:MAG: vWA domain-containing protein [Eubacteriales bacterium]|nr:vWA domain-containing protein [Eubacteriales bacterium]